MTEERTGISIYFANPYHSWERGTNENANGLLRQFFPKKSSFATITQEDIDEACSLLNNRPRKRLNYLTPFHYFSPKLAKKAFRSVSANGRDSPGFRSPKKTFIIRLLFKLLIVS